MPIVAPSALDLAAQTDTTPPAFSSAAVDWKTLTVTFNETLDTASLPAGSQFTLTGGQAGTGTVSVDGATASVTLNNAVSHGATVRVSYTQPSSNPLQDGTGNDVVSFSGEPVTNKTPLVANIGETAGSGELTVGPIGAVKSSHAPTFTTGSNMDGYTLSAVDVELGSRVGGGITRPSPHRPERARLTHSVPHMAGSLKRKAERSWGAGRVAVARGTAAAVPAFCPSSGAICGCDAIAISSISA